MIPYGRHFIDESDIEAVVELLRNGVLTQGPMVDAFERAVADYVGAKYAVAVSSGTAGLHLAALAAGMRPGRTLITSPITFVASSNAGLYCGGKVAFADVDPDTVNMSPAALRHQLEGNPETQVVMPVHFGGLPCDMPAIRALADEAGAVVIEDAAHALGASYPTGERVGSCKYSLMTVFSFHPVKTVAAGEGGVITTNSAEIWKRLLRFRSHGINKLDDTIEWPELANTDKLANPWYYEMQELGYHYRLTDIQSALAISQLRKIDRFLDRRRELAVAYDDALRDDESVRPAQTDGRNQNGHHIYPVRVDWNQLGISRAKLMHRMREQGVVTQVHYIPVPAHPHYRRLGFKPTDYPMAWDYYQQALTLPLYYSLSNDEQALVLSTFRVACR